MEKVIYVITHGEKHPNIPNPGLTVKGMMQIEQMAATKVSAEISKVICGTGKRHLETMKYLDLTADSYSPICGSPDSSDIKDGKKVALLADGTTFPLEQWIIPNTHNFLYGLEDKSLVIGGRPFLLGLGYNEAKEGQLIKITIVDEGIPIIGMIEILFSTDGKLDISL